MNKNHTEWQMFQIVHYLRRENGDRYEHDESIAKEMLVEMYKKFKSVSAVDKYLAKKKHAPVLVFPECSPFSSNRIVAKNI